jgi:DNA topoisomerase I
MRRYISRQKSGKGFSYALGSQKLSDTKALQRIESMVIPPAWTDVKIATNPRAKIQVEGRDTSGKKQYIYSQKHIETQHAAKFDRVVQFGLKLPTLRRQVKRDLKRRQYDKDKVIACAIALMDRAHLRVGNERYARQNSSYGLTTLRRKHVSVHGETIVFDFIGKSGKQQHIEIKDEEMARMVKRLWEMRGHELFRYYDEHNHLVDLKSDDVNAYIRRVIGPDFSAKDFRTWGGTLMAALELSRVEREAAPTARKKTLTACVKRVAEELGNTPAVARDSYIDPFVLELYESGDTISQIFADKKVRRSPFLSRQERCVIKLLTQKQG